MPNERRTKPVSHAHTPHTHTSLLCRSVHSAMSFLRLTTAPSVCSPAWCCQTCAHSPLSPQVHAFSTTVAARELIEVAHACACCHVNEYNFLYLLFPVAHIATVLSQACKCLLSKVAMRTRCSLLPPSRMPLRSPRSVLLRSRLYIVRAFVCNSLDV
jgi:hypothetical protein